MSRCFCETYKNSNLGQLFFGHRLTEHVFNPINHEKNTIFSLNVNVALCGLPVL